MAARELLIGDVVGPVAIVAPHPDDESLGCGGLIALLAEAGVSVEVVLTTDGSASHPGSRRWPPVRLSAVREGEMREALRRLGLGLGSERSLDAAGATGAIPPDASPARDTPLLALGLPDGAIPDVADARFDAAADALAARLDATGVRTLVAPWRRDAHADHRASHALARAALDRRRSTDRVRLLEYAVWADRATTDELPRPGEAIEWTLDIGRVRDRKADAVAAHRSQCGLVVDDDPHGFVLPAAMRERACGPVERFWEATA